MITRRRFIAAVPTVSAVALMPHSLPDQDVQCTEGLTFHLSDGRCLSYGIYGTPGGWPVLYFHGIPTSRIEARFFADAAHRNGCQLIAIDRPGFGWSNFQYSRRVVDWATDISEFVNSTQLPASVDLTQFSIACFSSGSAYALCCALSLPQTRLRSVGIVSGIAPLEKLGSCGGTSQIVFQFANRTPNAVATILDRNTRQMHRRPDRVLRRISHFFSPCDHSVFFERQNAQNLVDSYLQCVHSGPNGVVHDMSLLSRPWGVCLADVRSPVGLWYGACDITTPLQSMGSYLNRTLSNCQLAVYQGQGHLSMLNAVGDDLFQYLTSFVG